MHEHAGTRALLFAGMAMVDLHEERAKAMLKPMLIDNMKKETARQNVGLFIKQITYIQTTMRNKLAAKGGKVEVLRNQWDKVFAEIQGRATRKNEAEGDAFCAKVCGIRNHVRDYVLKAYVEKCRELYNIAFLQWRRKFPSKLRHDLEEIEEIMTARVKNLHNSVNPLMKVLEEHRRTLNINTDKFRKTYKLSDSR